MFIAVLTLFIQEVPPQYNWTIVESGIKHQKHSPNPIQEVVQLIFVSVLVTINNTNLWIKALFICIEAEAYIFIFTCIYKIFRDEKKLNLNSDGNNV